MERFFAPRRLVLMAMLTALTVVLARFMSFYLIPPDAIRVSFEGIPILLASVWLGPVSGLLVGGLADLIGALLFPVGAYFPPLTITPMLYGLIAGLIVHRVFKNGRELWQLVVAVFVAELLANVLYGSFAVQLYFNLLLSKGIGYEYMLLSRLPVRGVLFVVNCFGVVLIDKILGQRLGFSKVHTTEV